MRDRCLELRDHRDVALLQAPYKATPPRDPILVPRSFSHVLYNVGFGDPLELESLVEAWRRPLRCLSEAFAYRPEATAHRGCPTIVAAAGIPPRLLAHFVPRLICVSSSGGWICGRRWASAIWRS